MYRRFSGLFSQFLYSLCRTNLGSSKDKGGGAARLGLMGK